MDANLYFGLVVCDGKGESQYTERAQFFWRLHAKVTENPETLKKSLEVQVQTLPKNVLLPWKSNVDITIIGDNSNHLISDIELSSLTMLSPVIRHEEWDEYLINDPVIIPISLIVNVKNLEVMIYPLYKTRNPGDIKMLIGNDEVYANREIMIKFSDVFDVDANVFVIPDSITYQDFIIFLQFIHNYDDILKNCAEYDGYLTTTTILLLSATALHLESDIVLNECKRLMKEFVKPKSRSASPPAIIEDVELAPHMDFMVEVDQLFEMVEEIEEMVVVLEENLE